MELIHDNGFRPGRHGSLVAEQLLPTRAPEWADQATWDNLRLSQDSLVKRLNRTDEDWPGQRESMSRWYLLAFSGCVRALHGGRLPSVFRDA